MRVREFSLCLSVLLIGAAPCARAVSSYTCTVVPIDAGPNQPLLVYPTSIDNQEQVAGTWVGASNGFIVDNAGMSVPYTKPVSGIVIQDAMNNAGQVAGWVGDPRAPWDGRVGIGLAPAGGFLSKPDGTVAMLDPPPDTPTQTFVEIRVSGINDAGDVLGEIGVLDQNGVPGQYWFIRDASGSYTLFDPHPNPGVGNDPGGIPDVLGPVGSINNAGTAILGNRIRYADGSERALAFPWSANYGWIWYGINNKGFIVGNFTQYPYTSPFSVLLTPDGHAPAIVCPGMNGLLAFSINDEGVVAGAVPRNTAIVIARPTGLEPAVELSNTSWSFSPNPVGEKGGSGTIYLANNGVADLHIKTVATSAQDATDSPSDFRIRSNSCLTDVLGGGTAPKTFTPGEFCAITFTFMPMGVGARRAQLVVYDDAPDAPHVIRLDGTGIGKSNLVVSNNAWNLGAFPVGHTSLPGTIYIYNPGTDPVNNLGIAITGANASDVQITSSTCGAAFEPYKTCAVSFQFTPGAAGLRYANLTVSDDAPDGESIPMTGYGY